MSQTDSDADPLVPLAEEFADRRRRGERPSLTEYADRYPEHAERIRRLFPAMAVIEDLGSVEGPATGSLAQPAMDRAQAPRQLGDYLILREVGRGGMGIVYEAQQVSLGRRVALKVLPRQALKDDKALERFRREARAAARLHHTNIVPVFGVGEQDGLRYYVMQFIQGMGLDQVLDELKRLQVGSGNAPGDRRSMDSEPRVSWGDLSTTELAQSLLTGNSLPAREPTQHEPIASFAPTVDQALVVAPGEHPPGRPRVTRKGRDEMSPSASTAMLPGGAAARQSGKRRPAYWQSVARIGLQVAEALEHAHKQGVLHRDIKPSNLLLDYAGTVWVTDFGLARMEDQPNLTKSGDIVGTLRYMPPEAFDGRADRRGDVYSLGLTLYELLAMRPAFEEKQRHQLITRVTTGEPLRLDKLTREIPRDLVTIVHKAIDHETTQRYPTAGALADDLRHFLADEPIRARRPNLLVLAAKWSRRHRSAVTTGVVGLVLAMTVLAGSLGWIMRDGKARLELTEREVNRALLDAAELQRQAKWAEALEVAKRAEGILTVGGSQALRDRVTELRKDIEMVLRLERLRLPQHLQGTQGDDIRGTVVSYARAFSEYGIDLETIEPAEASRRIRARPIWLELAVALDDWVRLWKQIHPSNDAGWRRLIAAASAADPDPWRNKLRDAPEHPDYVTLARLVKSAPIEDMPMQTIDLLHGMLGNHKELDISVLRRAQRAHADDYWVNFKLAYSLDFADPPVQDLDEAVRFYTAARAARPRDAPVAFYLGYSLMHRGKRDEAVALYRTALALEPGYLTVYPHLASALADEGKEKEAMAVLLAAMGSNCKSPESLNNLAWFLATSRRVKLRNPSGAVELSRRAVDLAPENAAYWNTLGVALYRVGDWGGAIKALERSTALEGENSFDRLFLAMAHWQRGERDEARRHYDRAIGLMNAVKPSVEDLRFRAEADSLLQPRSRARAESKPEPR